MRSKEEFLRTERKFGQLLDDLRNGNYEDKERHYEKIEKYAFRYQRLLHSFQTGDNYDYGMIYHLPPTCYHLLPEKDVKKYVKELFDYVSWENFKEDKSGRIKI